MSVSLLDRASLYWRPVRVYIGRHRLRLLVISIGLVAFTTLLIRTAWLSDDAYITFRTIDNFFRHYGLTWNIDERVQAYTHPLWLLILAIGFYLTKDLFVTTLVISIAMSVATAALLCLAITRSAFAGALTLTVLALSRAFVDYSTSGLENPASHLLVVTFLALFLSGSPGAKRLGIQSFLAALAFVNRPDAILVFEEGRLVDQGAHEELVGRCETYREFLQAERRKEQLGVAPGTS